MSDLERQEQIVLLLRERPFASVRDLQAMTGVSAATVRRDIEKLRLAGRAQKVYGGVAAIESPTDRFAALPFLVNRDIAVAQKHAIAREAEKLVKDGTSIIVHGGSTCFHFGCRIAQRNLRIYTHSMPLASYLAEYGTCQLTVGGGDLHREPGVLYDRTIGSHCFYAAQFFVGALGVSRDGVLEQNPLLVQMSQEMSASAAEVVLLVDSRKFEARPPAVSLPFSRIARVITDDGLRDIDARMLEDAGVQIIIAQTEEQT